MTSPTHIEGIALGVTVGTQITSHLDAHLDPVLHLLGTDDGTLTACIHGMHRALHSSV